MVKLAYPDRNLRTERSTLGITLGDGQAVVGIGRYFILRLLGKGGMGAVYLAYDPDLSRKVAIKILRQDVMRLVEPSLAQTHRARMVREAKSLARLSHPNVVPVFAVGELVDRSFYIAMEYVAGRSLRDVLREPAHDWRTALGLVLQAGDGLAAAHDAGILHRDIKPDNILVGHDGVVRILDFGLARVASDPHENDSALVAEDSLIDDEAEDSQASITQSGMAMGTPGYMSPEQLRGDDIDARSDMFAFCCVLFEALTLRRPFPVLPVQVRLTAIATAPLEWPPNLPAWLCRRVAKGLAYAADERGPDLASLIADIRHGLATEERSRKRWTRAALLGVFVAAAVPGLAPKASLADPECNYAAQALDDLWNPQTRLQLIEGFAGHASPFSADLGREALAAIDEWRERWLQSAEQLCPETDFTLRVSGVEHQQSRACLAESRAEVAALIHLWALPTLQQVLESPQALRSLTAPDACLSPTVLHSRAPLPSDVGLRQRVLGLREKLEEVSVLTAQAEFSSASRLLTAVRTNVVHTEHLPTIAEYFAREATLADESTYHDSSAQAPLLRAYLWSVAANRGHLAATAIHWACFIAAYRTIQVEPALELLGGQVAAVQRAGNAVELLGPLARNRGSLALLRGDFAEVWRELTQQLAYIQAAHGSKSLQAAQALDDLGFVALATHEPTQALAYFQRAWDISSLKVPPGYPFRVQLLAFMAQAWAAASDTDAARFAYQRAMAECADAGLPHSACASSYVGLAILNASTGQWTQAIDSLHEWQALEHEFGRRVHRAFPWSDQLYAKVLAERGEVEQASELAARALARLRGQANVHPQAWAEAYVLSAHVALLAKDLPQARRDTAALAALVSVPSEFRERYIWQKDRLLAELAQLEGDSEGACEAAQRALAGAVAVRAANFEIAWVQLGWAQALAQCGEPKWALLQAHEAWQRACDDSGIARHQRVRFYATLVHVALDSHEVALAQDWLALAFEDLAQEEGSEDMRLDPLWRLAQRLGTTKAGFTASYRPWPHADKSRRL